MGSSSELNLISTLNGLSHCVRCDDYDASESEALSQLKDELAEE